MKKVLKMFNDAKHSISYTNDSCLNSVTLIFYSFISFKIFNIPVLVSKSPLQLSLCLEDLIRTENQCGTYLFSCYVD